MSEDKKNKLAEFDILIREAEARLSGYDEMTSLERRYIASLKKQRNEIANKKEKPGAPSSKPAE